jgi:hypothetical protein
MSIVNIHTEYDWTSIPRNSPYRDAAPYVKIKSYKITSSAALNRLRSYISLLADQTIDEFYNNLYTNTEEGNTYFFPYFGDTVRSFSNEFDDTFQNSVLGNIDGMLNTLAQETAIFSEAKALENMTKLGSNLSNMGRDVLRGNSTALSDASKGMSTAPGSYIETPKLYVYAQNDNSLDVSFPLYNSINEDAWEKNYQLIEELTIINRPKRLTAITMEQPYLYEVTLPGIRYMRWAYCSNFSVNLLGNRRIIDAKIIPDVYQMNLSFTSLTTEVSNFIEKSKSIASTPTPIPNTTPRGNIA